ncbi:hexokinase [Selenomonas sp. TAMA-11512]|uniref:hexokinase n=1 Tax=Selenomonas sp. TAMA-11512 TaxID=3095337 RepID=UPI00308CC742|nr:hexokinase [Selenomonas sp. TAMA-11512]
MAIDKEKCAEIIEAFDVRQDALRKIAEDFQADMRKGLAGDPASSMRMLKSYVGLPTGKETGEFLALDFGGTNVRALRILLKGGGDYEVLKKVTKPLVFEGVYDFVSAASEAKDQFDFIAGLIDEVIEENHETPYLLGHTFSFPSAQTNLYDARLITWTKEFATKGVEGEIVNDLLKAALDRIGALNVRPVAVINDTVATLLAAAYKTPDTYIGSIYATGQNTCYLEPFTGTSERAMIINMESGGFSKIMPSKYDEILDAASEKAGEQRMEKMVAGRYMGVLYSLALADLLGSDSAYNFTSIDLSAIVEDAYLDRHLAAEILERETGERFSQPECVLLQQLAAAIIVRSARLVAASYVGILLHLTGNGEITEQTIAIDGSVYEKMPLVKEELRNTFDELLGADAASIRIVLENDGSGLGASIAACIA